MSNITPQVEVNRIVEETIIQHRWSISKQKLPLSRQKECN